MSRRTVGIVIERLLNEEDLRVRFALDPIGTIARLRTSGVVLTPEEIDLFFRTDPRLWFWGTSVMGNQVH